MGDLLVKSGSQLDVYPVARTTAAASKYRPSDNITPFPSGENDSTCEGDTIPNFLALAKAKKPVGDPVPSSFVRIPQNRLCVLRNGEVGGKSNAANWHAISNMIHHGLLNEEKKTDGALSQHLPKPMNNQTS